MLLFRRLVLLQLNLMTQLLNQILLSISLITTGKYQDVILYSSVVNGVCSVGYATLWSLNSS